MSRRGNDFDEHRRTVVQILCDHHMVYQGGESLPNFEEKGKPTGEHFPLNSAFWERYFESTMEAESHRLIEEQMWGMRSHAPELAGAIDDIHFRSTAGQADARYVRERAKTGDMAAKSLITRYDWGVDLLTINLIDEELVCRYPRPRGKLEEKAMENQHGQIYEELCELRDDKPKRKDSEHKQELADRYNCSYRTITRIIEGREGAKRRRAS